MVSDVLAPTGMRILISFSLLALLILAAACGGEKKDDGPWLDPAASSTTTMPPPGTAPEVETGATVLVTLNDGSLATQQASIPRGPVVLTIANAGKEVHGLHVEGPGVSKALDSTVAGGAGGTMEVVFQSGTYELYCPVLDHRSKGESLTVTVPTP